MCRLAPAFSASLGRPLVGSPAAPRNRGAISGTESRECSVFHGAADAPSPAGKAPLPASNLAGQAGARSPADEGLPEARFDLFISGLAMEALIALGEAPHPVTRKQAANLPQARYLIDLIGVLEEKTRGNLSVDEERLLKDALYQLRMRYLNKTGGAG